jgi:hypothetical protein
VPTLAQVIHAYLALEDDESLQFCLSYWRGRTVLRWNPWAKPGTYDATIPPPAGGRDGEFIPTRFLQRWLISLAADSFRVRLPPALYGRTF